jgi:hypothetical protein
MMMTYYYKAQLADQYGPRHTTHFPLEKGHGSSHAYTPPPLRNGAFGLFAKDLRGSKAHRPTRSYLGSLLYVADIYRRTGQQVQVVWDTKTAHGF